ncbi:hypothetical protein [Oleiagrimonas soli]|uniref:Lipoprotein n=1 Tax=Oleiagrimonas soli TaxID=1543381 RepID=A0A099D0J6_9GAMM|nr:hypothetical protein [Oleiagrimonas soli]KGI78815.1 hypothetical protein LF63_0102400 [Oleiagrimonas soli]MBB6184405.1 hypothetical protein [Oleiagrimonas soli]
MRHLPIVACGLLIAALAGCSKSPAPDTPQPPNPKAASASTAMPASNPLTPLLNTRDRAKSVQQTLQAHDDAERKALQDAQQ